MIRHWLLGLAGWIYRHYAVPTVAVSDSVRALMLVAAPIVRDLDAITDPTSSEWKHATAFGRLVKQYPTANRRDIGLAIELAIRGL